jgi:hypothetical protein
VLRASGLARWVIAGMTRTRWIHVGLGVLLGPRGPLCGPRLLKPLGLPPGLDALSKLGFLPVAKLEVDRLPSRVPPRVDLPCAPCGQHDHKEKRDRCQASKDHPEPNAPTACLVHSTLGGTHLDCRGQPARTPQGRTAPQLRMALLVVARRAVAAHRHPCLRVDERILAQGAGLTLGAPR